MAIKVIMAVLSAAAVVVGGMQGLVQMRKLCLPDGGQAFYRKIISRVHAWLHASSPTSPWQPPSSVNVACELD
jgi:hypothetical protein